MRLIDMEDTIRLDRELSDLDKFVLKFVKVLQKHTKYTLISGYVAILLGRSRTTEDVDLFIPRINEHQFRELHRDLLNNGFWSVNVDDEEELFSMLNDNLSVRFAEKNKVIPNMEMKFVKDELDKLSLTDQTKVIIDKEELFISRIELQVAYKKYVLKSEKDLEDARHLQKLFNIDEEKINKYKIILEEYGRI